MFPLLFSVWVWHTVPEPNPLLTLDMSTSHLDTDCDYLVPSAWEAQLSHTDRQCVSCLISENKNPTESMSSQNTCPEPGWLENGYFCHKEELILRVNFISVSSTLWERSLHGPGVVSRSSCMHCASITYICSGFFGPPLAVICKHPSCSCSIHQARPTACRRPAALPHGTGLRSVIGPRMVTSTL